MFTLNSYFEIIELIYVFEEKGPNCWIELSMLPWIPPVR